MCLVEREKEKLDKTKNGKYKRFVTDRVDQIKEITNKDNLQWISTESMLRTKQLMPTKKFHNQIDGLMVFYF